MLRRAGAVHVGVTYAARKFCGNYRHRVTLIDRIGRERSNNRSFFSKAETIFCISLNSMYEKA